MIELFLDNTVLADIAIALLHFLWQGTLIAFSLAIVLKITPKSNAQLRYLLSTLALLACILCPFITYHLLQHSELSSVTSSLFNVASTQSHWTDSTLPWYQTGLIGEQWLAIITLSWLAVVTVLAGKLAFELYGVHQLRNHNVSAPSLALQAKFTELTQQLVIARTPQLLISSATKVPMAIGWLKPVVLIPCSMLSGLTPAQLNMLILHELAHIKRHDYAVNLLQTMVETLLFFHPGVHWISKNIRHERECCTDDIAVKHCDDALAYVHTLTDTANHCWKNQHHNTPAMAVAASGGDLKQRILRLVSPQQSKKQSSSAKWFSVALVLSTLGLANTGALVSNNVETMSLLAQAGFGDEKLHNSPAQAISPDFAMLKLASYDEEVAEHVELYKHQTDVIDNAKQYFFKQKSKASDKSKRQARLLKSKEPKYSLSARRNGLEREQDIASFFEEQAITVDTRFTDEAKLKLDKPALAIAFLSTANGRS